MKKLIISLTVLLLSACAPERHTKVVPYEKNVVHEYHQDDSSLYYYVLYSYLFNSNGTVATNHVYYYSQTTPIVGNNYSNIQFKTQEQLGDKETHNIQEGIMRSSEFKSEELDVKEIPQEIETAEQTEVNQAYEEYEAMENAADTSNGSQESSNEPAEASSSSDSGSSDSGGGSSD